MAELYVVGLGPGGGDGMTLRARQALQEAEVIVGYNVYLDLIRHELPGKEFLTTGMGREEERCRMALESACGGRVTALVCSGDAGVYGMAAPVLSLAPEYEGCRVEIIPGVTSALAAGALLGAPLGQDFCIISLSDLLTPWELIEKRLRAAAMGDFVIAIYNPCSHGRPDHLRRACGILLESLPSDRVCGLVRNADRPDMEVRICPLSELPMAGADMYSTVLVGNSFTRIIQGWMVTPRRIKQ